MWVLINYKKIYVNHGLTCVINYWLYFLHTQQVRAVQVSEESIKTAHTSSTNKQYAGF